MAIEMEDGSVGGRGIVRKSRQTNANVGGHPNLFGAGEWVRHSSAAARAAGRPAAGHPAAVRGWGRWGQSRTNRQLFNDFCHLAMLTWLMMSRMGSTR